MNHPQAPAGEGDAVGLEEENRRLRLALSRLSLEKEILQEALKKKV